MSGLNKPATAEAPAAGYRSAGIRWYLWEGGFLAVGQAGGEVPVHAHHAIQVFLTISGEAAVRAAAGEWRHARGVIVRPDVEHGFDARGSTGALLLIDPESSEGVWMQSALTEDITVVPDSRLQVCAEALRTFRERPLEALAPGDLIRHCVQALCAGVPPMRSIDPRIARVLQAIRDSNDLRMSLEEAAESVHLSPGRFTHLFKEELGLPFRRYMMWRKVTRAMLAMGRQQGIAAAAQEGDFADAAHLTRTFHQMFGMPPSVLMQGEFFEIAPPFTAATA
jgi:AraC-like DNA-binding protein